MTTHQLFFSLAHSLQTKGYLFFYFWKRHPALYLAYAALLGTFSTSISFLYLFLPFLILCFASRHFLLIALLIFLSFNLCNQFGIKRSIDESKTFHLLSVSDISPEQNGKNVNLKVYHPHLQKQGYLSLARSDLKKIEGATLLATFGSLKKLDHTFSLQGKTPKVLEKNNFSLPWLRYHLKKRLSRQLKKNMEQASIVSSLLFATPFPKKHQAAIQRFGLNHLFVISGFHFSFLAGLLTLLFKPFTSYRKLPKLLILLLSLYATLLGPSPSVLRSLITISLFHIAHLFNKEANTLNSLGVALIILLIFDPTFVHHLGFQLSFLFTASILVFCPLLTPHFPKNFIGSSFACFFSVHITAIITLLFLFGSFNFLSCLYNLLITPLVILILYLSHLCLFSKTVGFLTDKIIYFFLKLLDMPLSCDLIVEWYDFPPLLYSTCITIIFCLGVYFYSQKKGSHWAFPY